jgi:hypothetical protein
MDSVTAPWDYCGVDGFNDGILGLFLVEMMSAVAELGTIRALRIIRALKIIRIFRFID